MNPVLKACHCCGLVHRVPTLAPHQQARCARCNTRLLVRTHPHARARTAALALAALILYPLAISLPIMRIERLGHVHDTNVWQGVVQLLASGEWIVAAIVFSCSIVAPIAKLFAMLALSAPLPILRRQHRAATYRTVEWIGRWGMVDVLLVAVLIALVKLGNWVEVSPGPGLVAFASVVMLSLLSTATFDPHAIWQDEPSNPPPPHSPVSSDA